MRTRMTLTACLQGIANAMVCAVGVFGTWLTIGWLISFATDKTMVESGTVAFAIIWVGCLLGLVAGWFHGLARRGSLLLDCGGHPTRWLFLTNAVFFAIAGICGSFATDRFVGQLGTLFALSFAGYWVLMGMGRLGIHEHGIWTYWSFMKWGRIKDYSWSADGTLLVRTTGPLSFLFRVAIPVPQERLAEFKQLLVQRFPAAPTTNLSTLGATELKRYVKVAVSRQLQKTAGVVCVYAAFIAAFAKFGWSGVGVALLCAGFVSGVIVLANSTNIQLILRTAAWTLAGAFLGSFLLSGFLLGFLYGYDHGYGESNKSTIFAAVIGACVGALIHLWSTDNSSTGSQDR